MFPEHYANKIEVYMKDGTVYRGCYIDYKGSAENPFTYEEIVDKFRGLVTKVYSEETAKKLEENIANTVKYDNVNDMFVGL